MVQDINKWEIVCPQYTFSLRGQYTLYTIDGPNNINTVQT